MADDVVVVAAAAAADGAVADATAADDDDGVAAADVAAVAAAGVAAAAAGGGGGAVADPMAADDDDDDAVAVPAGWDGAGKTENDIAGEVLAFSQTLSGKEKDRRNAGLYFTGLEQLWLNDGSASFGQGDFEAITRSASQGKLYEACYTHLDEVMRDADARTASTNHVGNANKLDTFGHLHCHSAHLLSHEKLCHKAYGFVGEAGIGISFDNPPSTTATRPGKRKRRPVNRYGSAEPKEKRLKMLAGVQGHNGSSLKGHKFNKVYLKDQGTYYDTDDPSILLIPLLSMQQVMDWATDEAHAIDYDVMAVTFATKSTSASRDILQLALQKCSEAEIEQGRSLLETFVKGLAGSLVTKPVRENFTKTEERSTTLAQWISLVKNSKDRTVHEIGVPARLPLQPGRILRIAKGRMMLGTSKPDPWLMLLKAAINYSAFRGTKLMPACPPEEEDDGPPNTIQGMDVEQQRSQECFLSDALQRGGFTQGHLLYSS